jgi:hypothetical protein
MGARIRKIRHDENTRAKIQTSQIINRLSDHVFGKVELSATQVQSALGLLKKSMPDLAAVEHSGEMKVQHDITDVPVSDEQWEREHAATSH